tara:strand:- start:3136 stop:3345 length:210 start_codon:yes stop_codon:yes gene_type:complete
MKLVTNFSNKKLICLLIVLFAITLIYNYFSINIVEGIDEEDTAELQENNSEEKKKDETKKKYMLMNKIQ